MTNLNATLVGGDRENKTVNYLTFSERDNENINDFITDLEKVFAINRIVNNRKHLIIINCLKEIVANFFNKLVGIINWNIVE